MKLRLMNWLAIACTVFACGMACQNPNYRFEVSPGQQGQTELKRVPLTPQEQASRERERQVRAAMASPPPPPPEPDLATLESLWPKLSDADRAAVLDLAKRSAEAHP